jgi:hypothetical protein
MTPGAAVTGRRVPRFTVFGLPVANCFHLMEENSGGQVLVADKFKSQLPQVHNLTESLTISTKINVFQKSQFLKYTKDILKAKQIKKN